MAIDSATTSNVLATSMPSVLTEVAYHSNEMLAPDQTSDQDLDAFKLNDPSFKAAAAAAIAKAILAYYGIP